MKKFKTSIVLINYNSLADTIDCLKSILNTNHNIPFIVLVDNHSKDSDTITGTTAFYPHIHVIKNQVNTGFGRANNTGIEWILDNIVCEYIFILNNDTILKAGTISCLESSLNQADNKAGMATPKIFVYSNPQEIWYGGADINYKKMTPVIKQGEEPASTGFASGCAMFFRADVLQKVKGFDPFFFMYDEDVELSLRLKKLNYDILYVPEAQLYHKCQGSQTKEKNIPSNQLAPNHPGLLFYLKNTVMNRRYIIGKHLSGFDSLKASFYHKCYWLSKGVQFFLYGKLRAAYYTCKYLFMRLPAAMNK